MISRNLGITELGLTGSPPEATDLPDQKRWEQVPTARHWSGFFNNLVAASASWVESGSWFSSLKHPIFSNVAMMSVIAANWALLSEISSSYKEKAWREQVMDYNQENWKKKVKTRDNPLPVTWIHKQLFLDSRTVFGLLQEHLEEIVGEEVLPILLWLGPQWYHDKIERFSDTSSPIYYPEIKPNQITNDKIHIKKNCCYTRAYLSLWTKAFTYIIFHFFILEGQLVGCKDNWWKCEGNSFVSSCTQMLSSRIQNQILFVRIFRDEEMEKSDQNQKPTNSKT